MKRNKRMLLVVLLVTTLVVMSVNMFAQEKPLPEIKFPEIPYKPSIKKGWAGQFVYQISFNDSTSGGKGNNRVYYHIIANKTSSGYVELSMDIKGAIRSNQPDKNNGQRYESWINIGTKNSWSKHDETDTVIEPTALQGRDGIIGKLEKYSRYTSGDSWVKGWITNTDLQIDHTTGKYSFAVPLVQYELEGDETIVDIVYKPAKKDVRNRKEKKTHNTPGLNYLGLGDWNLLEGSFKDGQQEIVIRERIPVKLAQSHNDKPLPVKKGFIDFYLVLKKVG
jgi:hypothetical protein